MALTKRTIPVVRAPHVAPAGGSTHFLDWTPLAPGKLGEKLGRASVRQRDGLSRPFASDFGDAMQFVDLFAGLGGFHVALCQLGHHCVFACEIDETLRSLYCQNFGLEALGDIRQIDARFIPPHDILCAGFPCQPFSKAGDQQGLKCPRWGGLFENVLGILCHHLPKYLILENVPNLARHANGKTWKGMKASLEALGYTVQDRRYSPHQFGIPQIRDRIYIVGSLSGLDTFEWPEPEKASEPDIRSMLSQRPANARKLSPMVIDCLDVWQDFIRRFPEGEQLPSWPIWSMEFGATYPYETWTPQAVGLRSLCQYRGSHGLPLRELAPADRMSGLPSHARVEEPTFPDWKIEFIRKNRAIYAKHKKWIDQWMPSVLRFPSSLQKLEWNCKGGERNIWQYVIQFRASGVRVKRPTSSPSLVAMTTTQIPIIAWERRYMTPAECAKLQCLASLKHLPTAETKAFKALGNAVNVEVVKKIVAALWGAAARRWPPNLILARSAARIAKPN